MKNTPPALSPRRPSAVSGRLYPILTLGLLAAAAPSTRAGILAYEGFDYASGNALGGLSGGLGWSAPWQVVNSAGGSLNTVGTGLTAGGQAPAGYDAASTGGSVNLVSNFRGGRNLDTSPGGLLGTAGYIDGNGNVGADGKTIYLSFLQQTNGTGVFYEFELHRGDLGDGGRIAGIGNDQPGDNVNLRAPNSVHNSIGVGTTDVNFYIVRIDFKTGNDDIYVYQNPVSATEPGSASLLLINHDDLSFSGVSLGAFLNSRQVAHDEIRIGESWADMMAPVSGLPEAPQITVEPLPARNYAGGHVTLTAAVTGSPAPALQWYKGADPVPGATGAQLVLSNLPLSAAGNYHLRAVNASGTADSTAAAVTVLTPPDGLIAYEGFDYTEGVNNLAGHDGGLGWGGPWQMVNNGSDDILPGNLTAGSAGPSWLDSQSMGNYAFLNNARRDGRPLDLSVDGAFGTRGFLDESGRIGADGKTLYLSFLQQPNGTSLFYELEFHRDDLGDPGRIGGVGNDQPGDNVFMRGPNGIHSLIGPGSMDVSFYVVRIDFKPGPDDIRIYQNPVTGAEPETPTLLLADQADMSFTGLAMAAFANGRTVSHDELRLAETWEAAVASPYTVWLTEFTFPADADKTPAGDPDQDGVGNLLEYAFGTSPAAASPGPLAFTGNTLTTPGQPVVGGTAPAALQAVFTRRRDYASAGLVYRVQFSADLSTWQDNSASPVVVASNAATEAVQVPWPATVPVTGGGTAAPRFFRIAVTQQ